MCENRPGLSPKKARLSTGRRTGRGSLEAIAMDLDKMLTDAETEVSQ